MKKFATLFCAVLMSGTVLMAAKAQAGDNVTVTSWGGAYQEAQRKSIFQPWIAAGNTLTEAEYNGEIAKVRAMVEAKAVTWDVVSVDTQTVLAGCAEGTFETLDWGKLGLDRGNFLGGDVTDCGLPTDLLRHRRRLRHDQDGGTRQPLRGAVRHHQVSGQAGPAEGGLRQSRMGPSGRRRGA
jgi:hypothetical protein